MVIDSSQQFDEKARLKVLESYSILDTVQEEDYDNLTAIAAQICGTKISLMCPPAVSIILIQWLPVIRSKSGTSRTR